MKGGKKRNPKKNPIVTNFIFLYLGKVTIVFSKRT